MIRIYLEDIVGGAFDFILNNTDECALSLYNIEQYGCAVVDDLNKNGFDARLELSRDLTDLFFREHGEIFKECFIDNRVGVITTEQNLSEYIGANIYGHISVAVLKSLLCVSATDTLMLAVKNNQNTNKPKQLVRVRNE